MRSRLKVSKGCAAAWLLAGALLTSREAVFAKGVRRSEAPATPQVSTLDLTDGGSGVWSGSNAGQHVRLEFSAAGVRLSGPTAGPPGWAWSLSLLRYGRPDDPRDADFASPAASGSRLQLARRDLLEWFVNSDRGLEYGARIDAVGESGLAELEYTIDGTLTPKIREDGQAIALVDAKGSPVLKIQDLRSLDADGREVDVAWVTGAIAGEPMGRLRLRVQGASHTFPISVTALVVPGKTATVTAQTTVLPQSAPLAIPGNDQCPGAEVIPGSGPFPYTSGAYDITDASDTGDPSPPSCQPNVSHTIWFKFTPAATGNFTFALCTDAPTLTTVPDTVLAVYSASGPCSGLAEVTGGCDDDSCVSGAQQSVISALGLTGGSTYYIVASEFGTSPPVPGSSTIQLLVSQSSSGGAPPNDQCGGASVIPGSGPFPYLTAVTLDITGATDTGDPSAPSCQPNVSRSVWYSFSPTANGNYTFSSCADAPTGTTVDDTVMAIYGSNGVCSGLNELPGGCDDDSCAVEAGQAVISGVPLTAGQVYYIVVWKFDVVAPTIGNTAIQLSVDKSNAPGNDLCGAAVPLSLDTPATGTTANAADDYELVSGSACFRGIGQTATTAAGGDVAYKFTAASAGNYSFRVNGYDQTKNAVLYVASDCPAGPYPATIASCLAATNRNSGNPAEEVKCLPLAAGQTVYAYVDEVSASAGSVFNVEVSACANETEPNDTPATASDLSCGVEGSITPNGDADFFTLGTPDAGARVFAIVDGVSGSSTDFDLRVTTATDTVEYDDANNDTVFGSVSPNVAGAPLTGVASYLRVSLFSAIQQSEPYRLYAVAQRASATATPEAEPNNTIGTATSGANLYFSGTIGSATDVDVFQFSANAGDLGILGLDLDPTRDNTPFNGILALLDSGGAVLMTVNDSGSTSSTTSGAGSLTSKTPNSPAEALVYRIRATGTYYAKVSWSSGTTPGDYLLSIARNCRIFPATDVSVATTDAPDPVAPGANVTYTSTVRNVGTASAALVSLRDDLPAGGAFVSATPSQGSCAGSGPVLCQLGTIATGGAATVSIVVTAPASSGTLTNNARVAAMSADTNAANDVAAQSTTVGSPDADGDGVPDAQDCAPNDPTAWAIPGEATSVGFPVPSNKASVQWNAPASPGGTVVYYDLVRSTIASDFTTSTCIATHATATNASDSQTPTGPFFYLVRSENACGGNLGKRSDGTPRSARSCP